MSESHLHAPAGGRHATVERSTKETQIRVELTLPEGLHAGSPADGGPHEARIDTPIPFLTHMLESVAKHGAMALRVEAKGDVWIDGHHTVEDTGLVLGRAIDQALGDRHGIARFGHFSLCMDEVLIDCAIDLGGRPWLVYDVPDAAGRWIGEFDCELVKEFFQALVVQARMNLHLHQRAGGNAHHVVEACFKAFARALRMACARDPAAGLPSTKGSI